MHTIDVLQYLWLISFFFSVHFGIGFTESVGKKNGVVAEAEFLLSVKIILFTIPLNW